MTGRPPSPRLARRFVRWMERATHHAPLQIPPEVEHRLASYAWPGNIRELRNAIVSVVARARAQALRANAPTTAYRKFP